MARALTPKSDQPRMSAKSISRLQSPPSFQYRTTGIRSIAKRSAGRKSSR